MTDSDPISAAWPMLIALVTVWGLSPGRCLSLLIKSTISSFNALTSANTHSHIHELTVHQAAHVFQLHQNIGNIHLEVPRCDFSHHYAISTCAVGTGRAGAALGILRSLRTIRVEPASFSLSFRAVIFSQLKTFWPPSTFLQCGPSHLPQQDV